MAEHNRVTSSSRVQPDRHHERNTRWARGTLKVVDASAMIDVLSGTQRRAKLLPIFDDDLLAPALLISEVYSFLKRMEATRRLSRRDAEQIAHALQQAPIEYLPTWPYAEQMWNWRDNLSPYDSSYVALADDLGAPLITTDSRLGRAAANLVTVISI